MSLPISEVLANCQFALDEKDALLVSARRALHKIATVEPQSATTVLGVTEWAHALDVAQRIAVETLDRIGRLDDDRG